MKKLLSLLLSVLMILSFAGCASNSEKSAEQVVKDLQGVWVLSGSNTIEFSENTISINDQMTGTYTVNTETHNIDATLTASDGSVTIHLPYDYNSGSLTIYNNQGEALEKQ